MEQAVSNVELMFQKADADLKILAIRLERQLDMEESTNGGRNPLRLMKEIESVKAEYSNLRQEIEGIQTAQKEAVDYLRGQLTTMSEVLLRLDAQAGTQDSSEMEAHKGMFEELSQLLGVNKESLMPTLPSDHEKNELGGAAASASQSSIQTPQDNVTGGEEESHAKEEWKPSAAELREMSSDFVEVSEEEFASVSELIRGRAKLDDVNKTYQILWNHFKEEGNTGELSPKDMHSKGLRVTGATGQAKLKVLRALKLCKLSKNGGVTLI